ncbi:MAG: MFS transporter [Chloroflexi bacterium RBG_16_57_11]|nr:MAG: MFS transporter [Chloroflexi bacterium RBG_16_57_11]
MKFSPRQTFLALSYRNYRLWFYGQITSLFGTWMQITAQGFLIYELTRSPAYLGYVTFAAGLPSWLFMLVGGVAADRISRRTLMVITQTSMMILAFILAGLTFTGLVQPWHIILLAFLLGIANAFDAPARLALAPELVDKPDLTNAIALNATMFNTATVLGPTIGGLIYAAFGPGWCFMINGFSFIAVIVALLLMDLPKSSKPDRRRPSAFTEIRQGFAYTFAKPVILALMGIVLMTTTFGFSFVPLLPAWSVDVLGGDVRTNGLLYSAQGLGALIGALGIASLGRFNFRGKLLSAGTIFFPILLIIFSLLRWLPLSLLTLAGVGAALVLVMNLANSLVQTSTEDELRGRVSSIYTLTFFGFMPLGALLMSQIAENTSEPLALQIGGFVLLAFAGFLWIFFPQVRKLK